MKNESILNYLTNHDTGIAANVQHSKEENVLKKQSMEADNENFLPEILFITSYPPRECGIATYSQDLLKSLNHKFNNTFELTVCALESEHEQHNYSEEVKYKLNTSQENSFTKLAFQINKNEHIQVVLIQHEFGFFEKKEKEFEDFLTAITKPILLTFHTVLPEPGLVIKQTVQKIAEAVSSIIVMTHASADLLFHAYGIELEKITVIAHGTHLVPHSDKKLLKNKFELNGKIVLSTFGLLSPGKGIETTIEALPSLVEKYKNVVFLVIGKTHPAIIKRDGEEYRKKLEARVAELQLQQHVKFINYFMPQPELLEFLQLTDIYLFTSRDPNQAVSGTFSYAISCGCPVISTPIPHAQEVLNGDSGIIIDFDNSAQLSEAAVKLIEDEILRKNISSNGLHKMASTAWENSAVVHALQFEKISNHPIKLHFSMPKVNLDHIKKMTTEFGMIQFSKLNHPDIHSGYTLDDNARALIAVCQHFEKTHDENDISYLTTYFEFIKYCLQPEGYFLNYVDSERQFTEQNNTTNLADSNGRAIWALGYMISLKKLLPTELAEDAELTLKSALSHVSKIYSTRAMAFVIKGLYYRNLSTKSTQDNGLITELANRLVQMYRHESSNEWHWFESYFTYANSTLPEALLCAYLATQDEVYRDIAKKSFDFLLSKTFTQHRIHVISNKSWLHKGDALTPIAIGGEQPIDVAYTILALDKFYEVLKEKEYQHKMEIAFNWFLGNNHLNQIIYNPCTGGCYDGLEEHSVNLNQGAESTLSYLMARLTVGKSFRKPKENTVGLKEKLEKTELLLLA